MSACRNFEFLPLIMMAVIYGAMFIGMLVDYIFRAIGLYAISGKLGVDNACLAWIPYARHYQHGAIAGSISLGKREIKDPGIWMLVIPLASGVALGVAFIPAIIGVLFGVASAHIGAAGISVLCGIGILGAVALAFKAAISVL
ncbi:MAG: hypothetical protein RR244_08530, partial [Oscillospiraceae bacterium]